MLKKMLLFLVVLQTNECLILFLTMNIQAINSISIVLIATFQLLYR